MPPRPRDFSPGVHHVWVNATGNWSYFLDDVDRLTWVRRLARVLDRNGWTCLAFCQMRTHVHALLDVPDWSLPEGMRWLNREYGKDFNARHGRVGAFVRKRYGSRPVRDSADLLNAYAYVVLNPVRAGVCARPADWRWSSYATTLATSNHFPFVDASAVLAEFGGSNAGARERLRAFVAEQALDPRPVPPSDGP